MLNEFVTWWVGQLLQMLPARLSGAMAASAHALIVEPAAGDPTLVSLTMRRGRRDRALGAFDLASVDSRPLQAALRGRPPTVVLRVPHTAVLERDLTLPLAAERDLGRVLEYEIDRVTPFAAAEVFWTYRVRQRDRARARLNVQLSFITRASLQWLLDPLDRAGLGPTTIETTPGAGAPLRIDVRHDAASHRALSRGARRGLATLYAALLLAIAAIPFVMQSVAADRVEARIAALRPQVEAAELARRRIAANGAGIDVIAAARLRLGDTLAVLAAVTDLLPDDTSLTDLTLRQGKLTLNGQSAAAAKLIAILSADPLIRNPDFTAPVTRMNEGRTDLFAIRAEIASAP